MIVAVYRSLSQPMSTAFYNEFTTLLELLAIYSSPTITGDITVHLEKPDDVDSRKLLEIMDSFGVKQFVK